jgi:hypothetical protein
MPETIYDLACNQTKNCGKYDVTRVPGGWLYYNYTNGSSVCTFVHYNNEFNTDEDIEEKKENA